MRSFKFLKGYTGIVITSTMSGRFINRAIRPNHDTNIGGLLLNPTYSYDNGVLRENIVSRRV
jgi:hypothetical protein